MLVTVLCAVLAAVLAFGLFVGLYIANRKTKVPDDCAKDDLPEGCASCMLSCGRREEPFEARSLFVEAKKEDSDPKSEPPVATDDTKENDL